MRAVGAWLCVAMALASCKYPTLVGFPHYDHTKPLEAAKALGDDILRIEKAIQDVRDDRKQQAYGALLHAYVSMSNEWRGQVPYRAVDLWQPHNTPWSFYVRGQGRRLGRPPLQRFPRITCPAMVEAVELGGRGGDKTWFVPLILDRSSFAWENTWKWNWLGLKSRSEGKDPLPKVAFWLESHDSRPLDKKQYELRQDLCVLRGGCTLGAELGLKGNVCFHLPDSDEDALGLVFAIPANGKLGPGFYDVRVLPRIDKITARTKWGQTVAQALSCGNWYSVHECLKSLHACVARLQQCEEKASTARAVLGGSSARSDAKVFAAAMREYALGYFRDDMNALEKAFDGLAEELGDELVPELALRTLVCAVDAILVHDWHPCPVYLDNPSGSEECFSFIVCGDVQYDANLVDLRRLLAVLDPGIVLQTEGSAGLDEGALSRVREASFVLVAGDLGDGAAFSSSPLDIGLNVFGLDPPESPYTSIDGKGEYPELRAELNRFNKPVFAVPGNHDGLVGFGGVVNQALEFMSSVLQLLPGPTHLLGEGVTEANKHFPVLVDIPTLLQLYPIYDGLLEWSYELGPKNLGFQFRGQSFVGVNTYDLLQQERGSTGGVAFNWGGGLDIKSVIWFEVMSRWLAKRTARQNLFSIRRQFLFMHHDPRAGTPTPSRQATESYGNYDDLESIGSVATFGFFGLGWSTFFPIYIPVVTPLSNHLVRYLEYGSEKYQQEWMASGVWSSGALGEQVFNHRADRYYNAQPFVEAICRCLGAEEYGDGGLTHVFLGHNDIPAEEEWSHGDEGGAVFPASKFGPAKPPRTNILGWSRLFKQRAEETPRWARELPPVVDGRNARVIRLDDVGQTGSPHGFTLVTVHPAGERCPCPIPASAKQCAQVEPFLLH